MNIIDLVVVWLKENYDVKLCEETTSIAGTVISIKRPMGRDKKFILDALEDSRINIEWIDFNCAFNFQNTAIVYNDPEFFNKMRSIIDKILLSRDASFKIRQDED